MKTLIDPLTKERFIPKRSNQKFARPENRIRFHNQKSANFRNKLSHILDPLIKNVRLLDELLQGRDHGSFSTEYLKGRGFSFQIHSHVEVINGVSYWAIDRYIIINPKKGNNMWTFKRI